MKAPQLSIIVPNFNHARFLRQRLESILNQTFTNFEIILLDDASSDESLSILKEYKSNPGISHLVINEKNSGSAFHQWKKGIELARGEWIWIAESDDYADSHLLESLFNFYNEKAKDCGILYAQTTDVDVDGNPIYDRVNYTKSFEPNSWSADFVLDGNTFVKKYLSGKNVIPNASAVIFRKNLVDMNEFSSSGIVNMKHAGDWLFWILLCRKTKIGFVSDHLNFFREHPSSTRVHSDITVLKRRINEEILIRKKIADFYPELDQSPQWELIYARWFEKNQRISALNPEFYSFRQPGLSKMQFLRKFLQYKKRHGSR